MGGYALWKKMIKAFIPPVFLSLRNVVQPFYGIEGKFPSWAEAQAALNHDGLADYAADNILQTVWQAIQAVREGKAEFERDGVLFYEKDYNYPLLAALFYALAHVGQRADILDFGGSLGSTYFQNKDMLAAYGDDIHWSIVEQKHFVEFGRERLPEIQFFFSVDDFLTAGKSSDILLLSSVLQYFDDPYQYLAQILKAKFKYMLVDRTLFNFGGEGDRIAIQYVPPTIYAAQYPVWLLSYEKVMYMMKEGGYREICRWDSFDRMLVRDGLFRQRTLCSRGVLMERT